MARKKQTPADEQRAAADYYRLNVKAVEDLVGANAENSPKVSEEELRRYRSGPKIRLADWVKAVLIKVWFAGAVCFFFLWGLGTYVSDQLDQILILGVALGLVTDLLTNNLYRFYAKPAGANDRWMMFPKRKFITLPLNILYAFAVILCVVMTYNAVNAGIMAVTGDREHIALGVGPILFGVFAAGWDLLFIKIKHTLHAVVSDAKNSAGKGTGHG
ncbi:MAG: hypothetical protein J5889_05340 [Clostridia bacterium]|nr:hypothetical protein [Clostridia bacterium]